MKPEEEAILIECLRREQALKEADPPRTRENSWELYRRNEEKRYGPRWNAMQWFGGVSEAGRQRYVRAMHRLAEAGLLERCTDFGGKRVLHVRLTAEGRTLATQLLGTADYSAADGAPVDADALAPADTPSSVPDAADADSHVPSEPSGGPS